MKINFAFTCNNTVSICKDFQLNFFLSFTLREPDNSWKIRYSNCLMFYKYCGAQLWRYCSLDMIVLTFQRGKGWGRWQILSGHIIYLLHYIGWIFFSYTKARIFIFIEDWMNMCRIPVCCFALVFADNMRFNT